MSFERLAAATAIISFTDTVPAGEEICLAGVKAGKLTLTLLLLRLTETGTLNRSGKVSPSIKAKELRKGILSHAFKLFTSDCPSHFAIAPENLLCMLLSAGRGIATVRPVRSAYPILAAIPKLTPLFLVAAICFILSLLIRAHGLPFSGRI